MMRYSTSYECIVVDAAPESLPSARLKRFTLEFKHNYSLQYLNNITEIEYTRRAYPDGLIYLNPDELSSF